MGWPDGIRRRLPRSLAVSRTAPVQHVVSTPSESKSQLDPAGGDVRFHAQPAANRIRSIGQTGIGAVAERFETRVGRGPKIFPSTKSGGICARTNISRLR